MTFAVGHVEGGTGAGRKRPMRATPNPWPCICVDRILDPANPDDRALARYPIKLQDGRIGERRENPGYLASCPDCRERRPGSKTGQAYKRR